jgi:hypothetical protein
MMNKMARSRNIKPGFFLNDLLAEIDPLGRLLFAGLWTIADREGRIEDRSKRIKAEILPYDNCNVIELLDELNQRKFIMRYQVDGEKYIQIINWDKHQNPHVKEKSSTIPAPYLSGASIVQAQQADEDEKYNAGSDEIEVKKTKGNQENYTDEIDEKEITDNGTTSKPLYLQGVYEAPEKHHTSTVQEPEKHTTNPADSLNLIPDSLNLIPDSKEDTKDVSLSQQIQDIWKHYLKTFEGFFSRELTLTKDRKNKIKQRLQDGKSVEDIKLAISNIRKSPFHCGDNDTGKIHADITFICRNTGKVEEWANYEPKPQQQKVIPFNSKQQEAKNYDGYSTSIESNPQSSEQPKGKWDAFVYEG